MAFVYHGLFHVLDENGEKTLVDESAWGLKRLTGDDLTKFGEDMQEAFEPIVNGLSSGQIVLSDLEETITSSSGQKITVTIGKVLTFPNATSKFEFHPNFYKWAEVMKQDPNLNYKEPVWVDSTL